MALKNRTEVKVAIEAVTALVDENSYKETLNDNFAESTLFRKDVQDVATDVSGSFVLDFVDFDSYKVTQIGNTTFNLQNIEEGEIKYLLITKSSGHTVAFLAGTVEDENIDYITTLTSVNFQIFNKDGNLQIKAIDKTIPSSSETNKGISKLATQADAEGFAENTKAMTSLKVNQQREEKFDSWVAISFDSGDFTGWTGSGTGFYARYLKIGKTIFFTMAVTGTPSGTTTSLWYDLPSTINNSYINGVAVTVIGFRQGVGHIQIAGAQVVNGQIHIDNDTNFVASSHTFSVSGTWEVT